MTPHSARQSSGIRRLWWSAPVFVLFIWANWEPLPLSERYELPPVSFTAFDIGQTVSVTDSLRLTQTLTPLAGVSSIAINRSAGLIGMAYQHPGSLDRATRHIRSLYAHARVRDFNAYQGPVCPIPQTYVHFMYDLKKLLCLR